MVKSHPAGMRICYAIFAGISLRLCSISLRSFRTTFAAYLPTHIKSLWDFFQSLLNNHRDNQYIIILIILPTCVVNKRGKWSIKLSLTEKMVDILAKMVDIYETSLHFRALASGFNWRWVIFAGFGVGIWWCGGNWLYL